MSIENDPKRQFNLTERQQIFVNADGKCQKCGCELVDNNWHAHHITYHSDGGQTKVDNGEALCNECHQFKHRELRDSQPVSNFHKDYSWQERAVEYYFNELDRYCKQENSQELEQAYVVEVSPSGGKTIFSMKLAKELINRDLIDKVIYLVPRDSIKLGFADDCKRAGKIVKNKQTAISGEYMAIETSNNLAKMGNLRNHHGVVITYHGLNDSTLGQLDLLSTKYRLLFVFDEAHHGAGGIQDEVTNTWGKNMLHIQNLAYSVVAMTGTPVRADNKCIPFLKYQEIKEYDLKGEERDALRVEPCFKFTYVDAVRAGVARRLMCINIDPIVEYSKEGEIKSEFLSAIPPFDTKYVAYTALDASNGVIDDMLKKANNEIDRMRRNGDPDAACLVIGQRNSTKSSNALQHISGRIKNLFNENAVSVESVDGDEARKKIKKFKKGLDRFIVAKDMISEGTNLPRVRVVCILRKIGNKTFYEQLVHRTTRNDSDTRPEDAIIIQLAHSSLVLWGKQLEDSTSLIWLPDEDDNNGDSEGGTGTGSEQTDIFGISASLDGDILDDVIIGGQNYSDTDPAAKILFDKVSSAGVTRGQINLILREVKNKGIDINNIVSEDFNEENQPTLQQELEGILSETTKIVKKKAHFKKDSKYQDNIKYIWNTIKRMSGISLGMSNSTIIAKHNDPEKVIKDLYNNAKKFKW